MEGPVYKLEQVVQSKHGMEDFEGPLDLILYLLGKNKIEIQDIPIALILDQYLDYLKLREEMDLEIASEFITMAAQLMFIKTRMLLSIEDEEAQNEMDLLIKSLEERRSSENYARIKGIVLKLSTMSEFGQNISVRPPEPMERGKIITYDHEGQELLDALAELAGRNERKAPPALSNFSQIVRQEPYPVAGKANEILQRLRQWGVSSFRLLFKGSRSRSEMVATFIAVLELCKARMITLAGGEADCTVTPTEESGDTLSL